MRSVDEGRHMSEFAAAILGIGMGGSDQNTADS
jgi:hypothetical protein